MAADGPTHAAAVSGVRRYSDWQLENVCGTFILDEATRSGSVRALCLKTLFLRLREPVF
jgi:hypothetical protein